MIAESSVVTGFCSATGKSKVACLVHQSLSGLAMAYINDNINLVTDSGHCFL